MARVPEGGRRARESGPDKTDPSRRVFFNPVFGKRRVKIDKHKFNYSKIGNLFPTVSAFREKEELKKNRGGT
jgi:hypothetical protein